MCSWFAFVTALTVCRTSACARWLTYIACWHFAVGFSAPADRAGATFLAVLGYELMYTARLLANLMLRLLRLGSPLC